MQKDFFGTIIHTSNKLSALLESSQGFRVGEEVLETDGNYAIRRIKRIASNGRYLLTDNRWYTVNKLSYFLNESRGIYVGMVVLETDGNYSKRTVKRIASNGKYLLSDNRWYRRNQLQIIID